MAERYHFRLVGQDEIFEDDEGVLADSIEQAESEALQLIAEMHAQAETPNPAELWCLEIHGKNGRVLRSIQLF